MTTHPTNKPTFLKLFLLAAITAAYSFSSEAAVNKCTDANGKVIYSDQQCGDKDKAKTVDIKHSASQGQSNTTNRFDAAKYCRDGNRDLTDAELTVRMEAFSRSGYKGGQICCKDGKVAQCENLFK